MNPRLIGSYSRRTGIYPGNDVDVFARMDNLDTSYNPQTVYSRLQHVLVQHYGHADEGVREREKAPSVNMERTTGPLCPVPLLPDHSIWYLRHGPDLTAPVVGWFSSKLADEKSSGCTKSLGDEDEMVTVDPNFELVSLECEWVLNALPVSLGSWYSPW